MTYHQEALGNPWQVLERCLQALLLICTAWGLVAGIISPAILPFISSCAGGNWFQHGIPVVGLVTVIPALCATILIRTRAQAHTPIVVSATGVWLPVIGFILLLSSTSSFMVISDQGILP